MNWTRANWIRTWWTKMKKKLKRESGRVSELPTDRELKQENALEVEPRLLWQWIEVVRPKRDRWALQRENSKRRKKKDERKTMQEPKLWKEPYLQLSTQLCCLSFFFLFCYFSSIYYYYFSFVNCYYLLFSFVNYFYSYHIKFTQFIFLAKKFIKLLNWVKNLHSLIIKKKLLGRIINLDRPMLNICE